MSIKKHRRKLPFGRSRRFSILLKLVKTGRRYLGIPKTNENRAQKREAEQIPLRSMANLLRKIAPPLRETIKSIVGTGVLDGPQKKNEFPHTPNQPVGEAFRLPKTNENRK